MHVLVATAEGQGEREHDFCWAQEGELVYEAPACDCPECGCWWALAGLESQRAITTFKVVDLGLSPALYEEKIRAGLDRAGWLTGLSSAEASECAREETAFLLRIAGAYPPGTLLERERETIRPRQVRSGGTSVEAAREG